MMEARGLPAAADVIQRLKDDGDFDSLRIKIIRKVKENEELRSSIITEIKQSVVFNEDGSENLKPRQLSDGIYQEIGSKIMGQISDELWKVIRCDGMKNEIREAVESVYNRITNPMKEKEDLLSLSLQPPSKRRKEDGSSRSLQQPASAKDDNILLRTTSMPEKYSSDHRKSAEHPACALSIRQNAGDGNSKDQMSGLAFREQQQPSDVLEPINDELPPGFAPQQGQTETPGGAGDEDPDVPPGFG